MQLGRALCFFNDNRGLAMCATLQEHGKVTLVMWFISRALVAVNLNQGRSTLNQVNPHSQHLEILHSKYILIMRMFTM